MNKKYKIQKINHLGPSTTIYIFQNHMTEVEHTWLVGSRNHLEHPITNYTHGSHL